MKIEKIVITIVALTYLPTMLELAYLVIKLGFTQDYNSFLTAFSNWLGKAVIPWWLKPFEIIAKLPSLLATIGLIGLVWAISVSKKRGL